MKRILIFSIILSLFSGCASQNIFKKETKISQENIGYALVDKETGAILDQQNIDQPFIPASSLKIIVAYSSLSVLGKDYTFKTAIKLEKNWKEKIKNKIYDGDIYLEGDFDPILTISDITNMVLQLRKAGIREIKGNFFYKTSDIDCITEINESQPANVAYNSAVGTLNIARPDNLKNSIKVNDFMDSKQNGYLPIKNPTLFVAKLFRELASLHGIKIVAPEAYDSKRLALDTEIFLVHESPALKEIVKLMLNESVNEIAELLAIKTAQTIDGTREINSLTDVQEIITIWLKSKMPIDWENYYSQNASGLSSTSRITPNQFISILKKTVSLNLDDKSFISLLPISGWSGTLNSRLSDPQTNLRVYAKTGTVNYGDSLVGSLFANSNKELLFVILISDIDKRNLMDSKNNIFSSSDVKNSSSWTRKARILQDDLVKKWIKEN